MHEEATAVIDRPVRAREADRAGWRSVATMSAGAFAIGTDTFVVAGLLGDIAQEWGISVGAAGVTVTASSLAIAVGAPLLAAVLGGRPLRVLLAGSLSLFAAFELVAALAPSWGALLVARVLAALAAAVYAPTATAAAVAAVPDEQRGRALAAMVGGASVAMTVGAPAGVLLAAATSWRAAFGLIAVLAAGAAVAMLRCERESPALARVSFRARLRPLRSPELVGTLGITLLAMAASSVLYTYLGVLVDGTAGAGGIGLVIAAFGIGGLAGTWFGGSVADRWGSRVTVLVAIGVLAAAGPLISAAATVAGVAALAVGWGVASWGIVPAQQHRLLGLARGPAPVVLALNSSAIHLGSALGALLGGLVLDTSAADRLWWVSVACCGSVLLLQTRSRRGRGSHDRIDVDRHGLGRGGAGHGSRGVGASRRRGVPVRRADGPRTRRGVARGLRDRDPRRARYNGPTGVASGAARRGAHGRARPLPGSPRR
jgi:predicted MFS family arabinose efflux permease